MFKDLEHPYPTNIISFNTSKDNPGPANICTCTMQSISMVLPLSLDTLEHSYEFYTNIGS